VRGVIAASIFLGSNSPLTRSTSANTGTAPTLRIQDVEAPQVHGVVITSSPSPISSPIRAHISAACPEFVVST